MFAANLAAVVLTHLPAVAALVFQEGGMPRPLGLWKAMGLVAKTVVIILFIMSGWSIGVMIDRAMAYNAARKQSRAFAPAVAGALRDGRIDEAIKVAERNKKSHLAKVVTAGLMEFKAHRTVPAPFQARPLKRPSARWSAREAHCPRRTQARPGRIGHHRFDSPFVDCSEPWMGILNAFTGISKEKATGLAAVAVVSQKRW